MNKYYILVIAIFLSKGMDGQMRFGISESLNPNAVVQIDTADGYRKGLLLPRLQLRTTDDAFPLANHVQGMVVYNTAQLGTGATAVFPGYYYNDGTKWNKILSQKELSSVWLNASNGSTSYNETDKIYRTGNVGIGMNNPSEALDVKGNIKVSGGSNTGQVVIKQGNATESGMIDFMTPADQLVGSIGNNSLHMEYTTNDSLKHHIFNGGNVAIGTMDAPVKLVVNGAIKVGNENGTTNAPEAGMIRYNKSIGRFQGFNGTAWVDLHQ